MRDTLRLFFRVDGRIGRKPFWIGLAIVFGLEVAASFLLAGTGVWLSGVLILLFIPRLCVGTKRLHDIDKSGWYHLIPMGVAFVPKIAARGLAASGAAGPGAVSALNIAALAIWLVFYIWLGVKPSDQIVNAWGPPQTDRSAAAAAEAFD